MLDGGSKAQTTIAAGVTRRKFKKGKALDEEELEERKAEEDYRNVLIFIFHFNERSVSKALRGLF